MGRNSAKEYPLNFLEKGIREKNEVKYPKKLIGMGIRKKNETKYPEQLIGVGIKQKTSLRYPHNKNHEDKMMKKFSIPTKI